MKTQKKWMIAKLTGCILVSLLPYIAVAQRRWLQLTPSLIIFVQQASPPPSLQLEKQIQGKLTGVERQEYRVALERGEFVHIVVEQKGVDVAVTLYDPNGKKVLEVDSPNGTQGPEIVFAIAEETGQYRVEVAKPDREAPDKGSKDPYSSLLSYDSAGIHHFLKDGLKASARGEGTPQLGISLTVTVPTN